MITNKFSSLKLGILLLLLIGHTSFSFATELRRVSTRTSLRATTSVTIPSGQSIRFIPQQEWIDQNERYTAYFFTDGGGDEFADLTDLGNGEFEVIAPADYEKIIFVLMPKNNPTNDWANKIEQTEDLEWNGVGEVYYQTTSVMETSGRWGGSKDEKINKYFDVEPVCSDLNFFADPEYPGRFAGPEYFCKNGGVVTDYSHYMNYPSWFFFKIKEAGSLDLEINWTGSSAGSASIIDYAMWGPFTNSDVKIEDLKKEKTDFNGWNNQQSCNTYGMTSTFKEEIHVPNAQVDEFYILCVADYGGLGGEMSLSTMPANTASTDCDIVTECNIVSFDNTISETATDYALSGSVTFANAPTTGSMTVKDMTSGAETTLPAPFTSPFDYSLTGIPLGTAAAIGQLVFSFSAENTCTDTIDYDTPVGTSPPALSITAQGSIDTNCTTTFDGSGLGTAAGGTAPYTYSWKDASDTQVGTSENLDCVEEGNYTVTATDADGVSETTTVYIPNSPLPGCSISNITIINSTVDCTDNTYSISGVVNFANAPIGADLVLTETPSGKSVTITAPSSTEAIVSPASYEITGLTAGVTSGEIQATFSTTP